MRKSSLLVGIALTVLLFAPGSGRAGSVLTDDHGAIFENLTTVDTGDPMGRRPASADVALGDAINDFGGSSTSPVRNRVAVRNALAVGTTQPVPEPTSLSLIALAGIGYVARFLRRHRIGLTRVF